MRGKATLWRFSNLYCKFLVFLLLVSALLGCKKEPQEQVFELKEVSAFDVPKQLHWDFCRGQDTLCSENPDPNVTTYPEFVSEKPLFGKIHLPRELHTGLRGRWYYFALDQTGKAEQGYDILYFDLNCDLDLTNDKPLAVQQNPPKGATVSQSAIKNQICFDFLALPFNFDDEESRPLEIMPRLVVNEGDEKFLVLVTTTAFTGKIDIAGRNYDVWLGHNRFISGWFNNPLTALHLIPDGDFQRIQEYSGNLLTKWHRINDTDYHFSASPSGDRLIVQPYQGKYGIIKSRPANHSFKNAKISGVLYSGKDIYWFGGKSNRKPVSSCRIPVGDYALGLEIFFDDLHLSTGANIHSDGHRLARIDDPPVLSVKIREDVPFILDFSNKPEILFASPAKEHRLKKGEQLQIEAVLIDPVLDIMFTDIEKAKSGFVLPESDWNLVIFRGVAFGIVLAVIFWLLSVIIRSKRRVFLTLSGLIVAITVVPFVIYYFINHENEYDDISPTVLISRSNGENVAEGVMPFG